MEYQIRIMTEDDYDQLYQLWESCPGMSLIDLDDSREGIGKFIRRNPQTCFAAVADEKIVGSILVGQDGRRGYIYHTAVNEAYRRNGIATALVKTAMEELKAQRIAKVALVVLKNNEKGNAFWEKQGFFRRDDLYYRNIELLELKEVFVGQSVK